MVENDIVYQLIIYFFLNFASEYVKEATDGQQSCRSCLCAAENRDAAEVSAFLLLCIVKQLKLDHTNINYYFRKFRRSYVPTDFYDK